MSSIRRGQRIGAGILGLWLLAGAGFADEVAPETPVDGEDVATTPEPTPAELITEEVITVTATRFERPIDLTPQSVTVIEAVELACRPMVNVQGVLEEVPGISVSRSGGLGGQLVVRGLNSNDSRTVLFVDGDRFRGRPSIEYNVLDPNEIERIEVIRGPAAALYGSDAMNGVINVITRRAAPGDRDERFALRPRLFALGFASVSDLVATRLELSGQGQGFDLLIGGNYRTAGDYDTPDGEALTTRFTSASANLRFGYSPSADSRFELSAKAGEFEAGRATAPGAPLVTLREEPLEERAIRFGWSRQQATSWIDDVEASLYFRELSTFIHGETRTAANGNVEFRDTWVIGPEVSGGKLLARTAFSSSVLSYGVDLYHEDVAGFDDEVRVIDRAGNTVTFSPRDKRIRAAKQRNVGALVHYDWDPSERLTVSGGARYDWVRTEFEAAPAPGEDPILSAAYAASLSGVDEKLTGSLGAIYRPDPRIHLVANLSNAFRSPTTFDKSGSGVIGSVTTIPNLEVEPETSVTWEVGARLRLARASANLTVFRTDYQDLLQLVFLDPRTRQRLNIGEARIDGAELDATVELGERWVLRLDAARVEGTNELTGVPLAGVPPLNGGVALRYDGGNDLYWLGARARWSRDKTRIDRTQERPTDGYEVFAIEAGIDLGRLRPAFEAYGLTVGVENLLDERYVNPTTRESLGFPRSATNPLLEPGRSFVVNLTARF